MPPLSPAVLAALLCSCSIDDRVAVIGDGDGRPAGSLFPRIAAGQPLPDEATCAMRVRRSPWEPRPGNTPANHTVPTAAELMQLVPWGANIGFDDRARPLGQRVTGNFTGTTDEILQWVACKWGFPDDLVRAMAVESSRWRQTGLGCWTTSTADCPPGAATRTTGSATECAGCYGILQVRWEFHSSTWPMVRNSTAFDVDYVVGLRRACFEGWVSYHARSAPPDHPYRPDDEWGCIGAGFSGSWYDADAVDHIAAVEEHLASRPWTRPGF